MVCTDIWLTLEWDKDDQVAGAKDAVGDVRLRVYVVLGNHPTVNPEDEKDMGKMIRDAFSGAFQGLIPIPLIPWDQIKATTNLPDFIKGLLPSVNDRIWDKFMEHVMPIDTTFVDPYGKYIWVYLEWDRCEQYIPYLGWGNRVRLHWVPVFTKVEHPAIPNITLNYNSSHVLQAADSVYGLSPDVVAGYCAKAIAYMVEKYPCPRP